MKAIATITLIVATVLPSIGLASGLFPDNPVPMTEGYGKDGAGLHYAVPEGIPGSDCVVNPVSPRWGQRTVIETSEVEVSNMVPGTVISIPAKVLFDFDGDIIRDAAYEDLYAFLLTLVDLGALEVTVIGHTDSKGTDEYNQDLGQRRAQAVVDFFEARAAGATFYAESRGESEPLASNTNEDGSDNPINRQINRRVDLRIDKSMVEVKSVEIVETPTVVLFERNPQVFHRFGRGNQVYCGADGSLSGYGPQYFWWSGR